MISLHHVTHAVCLVVIAFLLKKHTELRTVHSHLKLEHLRLKTSCSSPSPPGGGGAGVDTQAGGPCPCPCPGPGQSAGDPDPHQQQVAPSQTDVETRSRRALSDQSRWQGGLASALAEEGMFADALDASSAAAADPPVDHFGRSLDDAAADQRSRAGAGGRGAEEEIQGSATSAGGGVFLPNPQLPPLHREPVQPAFTSTSSQAISAGASEPAAVARQRGDGSTEGSDHETPVSFHSTSESLESVTLSPSSVSAHSSSSVQKSSGVAADHRHQAESVAAAQDDAAGDDGDAFYLGSQSRQGGGGGEEEEVNVIVTSAEGILNTAFHPHGVDQFSQESSDGGDDDDEYYYEEWEEEDVVVEEDSEQQEEGEPPPHPAFGKVSNLHWLSESEVERLSARGSSVQCTGATVSDRTCRFSDLCFQPGTQKFVFLLGPQSVQDNVPAPLEELPQHQGEGLLELSTVAGHNAQHFSYLTLPASDAKGFNVAAVSGTTVVFRRFKPDNVMHVLHDDVIPLFHTLLRSLNLRPRPGGTGSDGGGGGGKFPVSLFLADENSEGEFYTDLYDAFALNGAFTSESLIAAVVAAAAETSTSSSSRRSSLVCFPEAHVGLSKATTWYQYGFFQPQGPLPDSGAHSHHLHGVASFLLSGGGSLAEDSCPLCGLGGHLVFLSRKDTRRVLNEMDLVLAISKQFRVKVMTVSLETHSLAEVVQVVHSSRGMVGMHGSLLSLAMFLRQGSAVVELFPYGVDPHGYTPYRTLCGIPGMLIAYRAWTNRDKGRSRPHPDWPPQLGGLRHLPRQQQQEIAQQVRFGG